MLALSVQHDLDKLAERLDRLHQSRQIPFAAALAVTDVAYKARDEVRVKLASAFDRPVPLTRRAHFAQFAGGARRASKDAPWATVGVVSEVSKGTPPARYLEAELAGGARKLKPYERQLQRAGVLKDGWYTVAARGAPLDRFGNISGPIINAALSYLRVSSDRFQNRAVGKVKAKLRQFFVVFPDQGALSNGRKLPPGIYMRTPGGGFRSFVVFVRGAPNYGVRLNVKRIVQMAVRRHFPQAIERAIAYALRTARK